MHGLKSNYFEFLISFCNFKILFYFLNVFKISVKVDLYQSLN